MASSAAGRLRPSGSASGAAELAAALRRAVRGRVDFGPGARALYAADASNYRQVPLGVVVPESVEDVLAAVGVCADHEAPVLCRGGGTAMAGQTANAAVVLDFSRHLDEVLELDPDARTDVRAGPRHPRPLHAGRDDRQRLLRNPLGGLRAHLPERPVPAGAHLRRSAPGSGRDRRGRACGDHRGGRRRGEIYQGLRDLRDRYGMLIRERCLAGNFGFERGHHDVSIACAERVMAPAIRAADSDTLVVADGFSCRTQIEHATDRRALHLAEVLDAAITTGGVAADG